MSAAAVGIALVDRAQEHAERIAIVDAAGEHRYADLLAASQRVASGLLALQQSADLGGERVCFMVGPSFAHVALQWGIFRAGGVAVPLCLSHPAPELAHVIDDARPFALIFEPAYAPLLQPLAAERGLPTRSPDELLASTASSLPQIADERPAMLIYTSGTTGKAKGAIATHAILQAQMQSIARAWELGSSDRLLHVLPLHHLHGILNALAAPLYAGACVELMPRFDPALAIERFVRGPALTLFMAVPTIYAKLVQCADALSATERAQLHSALAQLRVIISGSAALPVSLLARFRELSGHVLLERYGMTELGMALGNPLHGERRAGTVGLPFPEVEARIVDERGEQLGEAQSGELQIRGPNVFAGYWNQPDATGRAFTSDGFFRTGDVAVREDGYYRLLGRESVDILKTGGFKVSALEIEEVLREHPAIAEVAVVGMPDPEWGERVVAAVVLEAGHTLELDELRAFGKQRLAPYKVPTVLRCFDALPRNALGKVQKPVISALLREG
jgi:malonyl-CoA/methylmalonyl-CoA synthetase